MTVTRMETSRCHGFWGGHACVCLCKLTPARRTASGGGRGSETPCTTAPQPGLAQAISDRGLHARLLDYHPPTVQPASERGWQCDHSSRSPELQQDGGGTYAPENQAASAAGRIVLANKIRKQPITNQPCITADPVARPIAG